MWQKWRQGESKHMKIWPILAQRVTNRMSSNAGSFRSKSRTNWQRLNPETQSYNPKTRNSAFIPRVESDSSLEIKRIVQCLLTPWLQPWKDFKGRPRWTFCTWVSHLQNQEIINIVIKFMATYYSINTKLICFLQHAYILIYICFEILNKCYLCM